MKTAPLTQTSHHGLMPPVPTSLGEQNSHTLPATEEGPPIGICAHEHQKWGQEPLYHSAESYWVQDQQWLPEWPAVFSLYVLYVRPYLSSHSPNPDSLTCIRPSTRQLEGFRLPWDLSGLLWRNSMPWESGNEHTNESRCRWT